MSPEIFINISWYAGMLVCIHPQGLYNVLIRHLPSTGLQSIIESNESRIDNQQLSPAREIYTTWKTDSRYHAQVLISIHQSVKQFKTINIYVVIELAMGALPPKTGFC